MRQFLAIELPEESKEKLSEQLNILQEEYGQFNWVPKNNYHITLHFIGETDDPQKLIKQVEEIVFDNSPFYLFAFGADLFLHNDRITLHINFYREKKLEEIVSKIKTVFNDDKNFKFVPHLTIGHYKIPSKQQYLHLKKKLHQLPVDLNFEIKNIVLFESISGGKNPIFRKVMKFDLAK